MSAPVPAQGYRAAVDYIAQNDEPTESDAKIMEGYASVHAVAVGFGKDFRKVARDVIKRRDVVRGLDIGW